MQNTDVENTVKLFHGELITLKEDCGYITYVFRNLEECDILHKYLMCVRFPNWECEFLQIGDKGFVKYKEVYAGKDSWYDTTSDSFIPYKYTDIHFINFVYDKPKQKDIIL